MSPPPSPPTALLPLLLLLPPMTTSSSTPSPLSWVARTSYDDSPTERLGRHHPITFANETHGFLLGGSTSDIGAVSDLRIYHEADDAWIDASHVLLASEYPSRTYGYGVVLDEAYHAKAYLGFGSDAYGNRMRDWWEFDMSTLVFRRLADFPGEARHHPSVVPVYVNDGDGGGGGDGEMEGWQIHVGLGDGLIGENMEFVNFDDYWSYSINDDAWTRLSDFPGGKRHHPFYFGIGGTSYVGFGHGDASPYVYRDLYRYEGGTWHGEDDFVSYDYDESTVRAPSIATMEGRVAGTQFSMAFPPPHTSRDGVSTDDLRGSAGFILSGDGDDHDYMPQGEFHAYFPRPAETVTHEDDDSDASSYPRWRALPPHPGASRWAPGSFVMRGSARAYFLCGYDRYTNEHRSDVWGIDLSSLFSPRSDVGAATPSTTTTTTTSSIATMTSAFAAPTASPWTVASNNADLDTTDDDVEVFDVACATRDECDARRSDMNMTAFRVGNYPSKGCFAKNGIAYWSYGGDAEEMSLGDLPGEQERIWCAGGGNGGGGRHSSPTPAVASSTSAILIPSSSSVKIRTATLVVGTSVIAICWLVQ